MGRRKLPLMCSKCKRTPDQVKIYGNRRCIDCLREDNRANYQKRKIELNAEAETVSARSFPTEAKLILTPNGESIYTDHHWEEFNKDNPDEVKWRWAEAEERLRKGTYERDLAIAMRELQ